LKVYWRKARLTDSTAMFSNFDLGETKRGEASERQIGAPDISAR
jgi:hypothetical protein